MLSKQEARDYFGDDEWRRRYEDELRRERDRETDRQRQQAYWEQLQQLHKHRQQTPPAPPVYVTGTGASLATDGIVIESANGQRVVVRGELLKTLATLVTMAQLAGLMPDEPTKTP